MFFWQTTKLSAFGYVFYCFVSLNKLPADYGWDNLTINGTRRLHVISSIIILNVVKKKSINNLPNIIIEKMRLKCKS